jgi:hypothetical protein
MRAATRCNNASTDGLNLAVCCAICARSIAFLGPEARLGLRPPAALASQCSTLPFVLMAHLMLDFPRSHFFQLRQCRICSLSEEPLVFPHQTRSSRPSPRAPFERQPCFNGNSAIVLPRSRSTSGKPSGHSAEWSLRGPHTSGGGDCASLSGSDGDELPA